MKLKRRFLLAFTAALLIVLMGASGCGGSPSSSSDQKKAEDKTDYAVGETIAYEGKAVTVVSVERNYHFDDKYYTPEKNYDSGNKYDKPEAGKEFVKVNIKMDNKSDANVSYNSNEWEIQDSSGDIQKVDKRLQLTADGALHSGELAPGGSKTADLYFQAPSGDAGLVLHYQPAYANNKTYNIKL